MRNIVLYIPSIEAGGVEKNLYYLINYFNLKFKKIYLVTASKARKLKNNRKVNIINPKTNFFYNKSRILKTLVCFYLILKHFKGKEILILSFQSNFSSLLASKIINSKIIIRLNTSTEKYIKGYLKRFFFKNLYKLADEVIVNSYEFGKNIKKNFGLSTKIILNPIKKHNIKKKKINFFKNFKGLKILTIGRLTNQKDHLTLLKAAQLLKFKYNLNFKLYLIGRGYNQNFLSKFVEKNNLNKNIMLAGYKKNAQEYLKSSDL